MSQIPTHDKPTVANVLLDIVDQRAYLFHDQLEVAWARVDGNCWPVKSKKFKRWLQDAYYTCEGKPPNGTSLSDALDQIEAISLYRSFTIEVNQRTAYYDNGIYLDLADESKHIVEIKPTGWQLGTTQTMYFTKSPGMHALPIPKPNGNIDALRNFINVGSDEDFRLLISWILAAFNPTIACPILILQGEQGSAKSTTAKVIRSLIDPNAAPVNSLPNNERDILIQAYHSRILCYDNLSGIKNNLSDVLCRICTGSGFSTRQLFKNDELKIFTARRPIILNGIDDIASRGDLMDRSIVLNLPRISAEDRKDERRFWKEYQHMAPYIMGSFFDALSTGLSNQRDVSLTKLPRMADYAEWVTACEPSFNFPSETFLNDYNTNKEQAIKLGLDGDVMATAIQRILEDQQDWEGTASELIESIKFAIPEESGRNLPSTRTLRSRLTRLSPGLRAVGITWERNRISKGTSYKLKKDPSGMQDLQILQDSMSIN